MATAQYNIYDIALVDLVTMRRIQDTGGKCQVCINGSGDKQTLYDPDNGYTAILAANNPLTITKGKIRFAVAESVSLVDLYIMAPGGQFLVQRSVVKGEQEFYIDTSRRHQVAVIPMSHADSTAATEQDTGFDFPVGAMVLPNPAVDVNTIDATEDVDVGILSTETGDADGFIDGVTTATAGTQKATLLASGDTMGALLSVLDSANAGDDAPEGYVVLSTGVSISYTTSTGSDTFDGFAILPYILMQ